MFGNAANDIQDLADGGNIAGEVLNRLRTFADLNGQSVDIAGRAQHHLGASGAFFRSTFGGGCGSAGITGNLMHRAAHLIDRRRDQFGFDLLITGMFGRGAQLRQQLARLRCHLGGIADDLIQNALQGADESIEAFGQHGGFLFAADRQALAQVAATFANLIQCFGGDLYRPQQPAVQGDQHQ